MQKRIKSETIRLPPINLYLEDIESIYQIFKNNCDEVAILTDNYFITNIENLNNLEGEVLHNVTIRGCLKGIPDYISFYAKPNDAYIYTENSTPLNLGIMQTIKQVIQPRTRKIHRIFISFIGIIFIMFVPLILLIVSSTLLKGIIEYLVFGLIIVLWILLFSRYRRLSEKIYSTVFMTKRKQVVSNFSKFKGEIIVGIIVGIITSAASVILTLVATRFFK